MRLAIWLLLAIPVSASWFGSDQDYTKWNTQDLRLWLAEHGIHAPEGYSTEELQSLVKANWEESTEWTADQYEKAQKIFQDVKQSSFDAWDESRLRQFLLEQGVVAPSSKKEELLLLAKKRYTAFTNAASSWASTASSYASSASDSASTAVHGGPIDHATSSLSSAIAAATTSVARALDDSQDYIYSTWSDSDLRAYLEKQGVVKTDAELTRDQMLAEMRTAYASVADPVWSAWSTNYMHDWLVAHDIIKPKYHKKRNAMAGQLASYYYSVSDTVYSTWDDSALKAWLLSNNFIVKSDRKFEHEKLLQLVQDKFAAAPSTLYSGWYDSELRQWLIDNGHLKSDAQVGRDRLVTLMASKYHDANSLVADYTVWPDARLRAFLRNQGATEANMPTTRADLLHQVRLRWVQTKWASEGLYHKLRDVVSSTYETAEDKLSKVMDILKGAKDDAAAAGEHATGRVKSEL